MSILSATEIETLKGMAIYWREALYREPPDERGRIMAAELTNVTQSIGAEKVLRILNEYVEDLSDKEPT